MRPGLKPHGPRRILGCTWQNWVATAVVFTSVSAYAQDAAVTAGVDVLASTDPSMQLLVFLLNQLGLPGVFAWLGHRGLKVIELGKPVKIQMIGNAAPADTEG